MKKILLTSLLCGSALVAMAENTISVVASSGAPDSKVNVKVAMNTDVNDACAFQCDITLPDGVTLATPDENLSTTTLTSKHTLASNLLDGNKYRIVCYSMTNSVISGNGDVASFDVVAPSANGTYTFTVDNVEIVSLAEIKAIVSSGVSGDLTVNNGGKLGDLNNDTKVDAVDLGFEINYILAADPNGDLTGDGKTDAVDLGLLINIVLGK